MASHGIWHGACRFFTILWRIVYTLVAGLYRTVRFLVCSGRKAYRAYTNAPCWLRAIILYALLALGLFLCLWLDEPLFNAMPAKSIDRERAFAGFFRRSGELIVWLAVAAAWVMIDWRLIHVKLPRWPGWGVRKTLCWAWQTVTRFRFTRGGMLFLSALLSGLMAEILKVFIRRERAHWLGHDGSTFRPWWDDTLPYWDAVWSIFRNNGLSTPSSHTAVAFGAAFALCRLFPRAWPVWMFFAVGCGISRLLDRAHVISDVYLAAILAYVVVWLIFAWIGPQSREGLDDLGLHDEVALNHHTDGSGI